MGVKRTTIVSSKKFDMKKITVKLEKPCSEKYSDFRKTNLGGFCDACSKEVIDFTKMSDHELIDFLSNGNSNLCGRLKTSQLGTYDVHQKKPKRKWALIPIFLAVTALIIPEKSPAQQKPNTEQMDITKAGPNQSADQTDKIYITGTVKEPDFNSLPGVNVILKGTSIGTVTDIDGKFILVIPKSQVTKSPTIQFSFIGLIEQEVEVGLENQHINIIMEPEILGGIGEFVVGGVTVRRFSPRNWFGVRGVWRRIKGGFYNLTHKN